ncbi:MAG: hypothetical protein R3B09_16075 [Nannocystaceae bacterium]
MEDVFGPPPGATTPTTGTTTTPNTAGTGAAGTGTTNPGELSMDDVFGGSAGGGGAPSDGTPSDGGTPSGGGAPISGGAVSVTPPPAASTERPRLFDPEKFTTRTRIISSVYSDVDRTDKLGRISRNENRLEFYFAYTPNKKVQIVGDIEPVYMGTSQAKELDDLATMQLINRFHVESRAAYVALTDLAPGLDIKVGRQIVVWGTADKFNPTNNINPDDLEDRPLFTEPIANQMVVIDWAPLRDRLWFQGVYVPLFFPALLPPSAAAGLKDPYAEVPFAYDVDKQKIFYLQDTFIPQNPKLLPRVVGHVVMPDTTFANGQAAAKVGARIADIDISASYYYGRFDIPIPFDVQSSVLTPLSGDPTPDGYYLQSDAYLHYPKMQVIGLDFTTQVPFLGNMGIWGEAGLFIPKEEKLRIEMPLPTGVDVTPNDGMANPVKMVEGVSIQKTPFIKATVGLDYTIGKHVYLQSQYLRGFIDEFGANHVGDYLLAGTDLIFFGRHLIFRTFGLVDFPSNNPKGEGASGVIAPALLVTPPAGFLQFQLGSFAFLGESGARTKFGQKAVGSSIVYFKVIGSF